MCELFGLSSATPVRVCYSLRAFAEHGGLLHPNKSGWGVAYHEGRDALLVKEPRPASDSATARFVESLGIATNSMIAHVRYATVGEPSYANTHPFMRELGGRMHVFAHNGDLADIHDRFSLKPSSFRPVGATDSEFAFCLLLGRLEPVWRRSEGVPTLGERFAIFAATAAELSTLGAANFLYTDGDALFVHGHRRCWDEGHGRFSAPRAPGLSIARGSELKVSGLHVRAHGVAGDALYVASVPLTASGWEPLPEGTVLALRDGREEARHVPAAV